MSSIYKIFIFVYVSSPGLRGITHRSSTCLAMVPRQAWQALSWSRTLSVRKGWRAFPLWNHIRSISWWIYIDQNSASRAFNGSWGFQEEGFWHSVYPILNCNTTRPDLQVQYLVPTLYLVNGYRFSFHDMFSLLVRSSWMITGCNSSHMVVHHTYVVVTLIDMEGHAWRQIDVMYSSSSLELKYYTTSTRRMV